MDKWLAFARMENGDTAVGQVVVLHDQNLLWLRLHHKHDVGPMPERWLFINANDGSIVSDRHRTSGSAADVIMAWIYPLHAGSAFGIIGRILVSVAGLAVMLAIATGLLLWSRKRTARKRGQMVSTAKAVSSRQTEGAPAS
jgi:uncharacterized iron-regulated membrane protein